MAANIALHLIKQLTQQVLHQLQALVLMFQILLKITLFSLFQLLLGLQLLGYLLVILIQLTPVHPWPNLFRKIHYLVLGHWYNGMGTLRYCLRAPIRFMSQEKAV